MDHDAVEKMVDITVQELHKTTEGHMGIIVLAMVPQEDGKLAVVFQSNMSVSRVITVLENFIERAKQQVN
jgi:hypothetical protein